MEHSPSVSLVLTQALKHRAAMMAVIVAMTRDFNVAEDICQDAMLTIIKSQDRFQADREFLPWAKGIARNLALRYLQSRKTAAVPLENEILETFAAAMSEGNESDAWEKRRAALHACLLKLPPHSRQLLLLRYAENLVGPALAQKAQVSLNSLRTTLGRIRKLVRDCITKHTAQEEALGGGSL